MRSSQAMVASVLYLHYVLDLWFERVVRHHLRGEAYLVRYIDDCVPRGTSRKGGVALHER